MQLDLRFANMARCQVIDFLNLNLLCVNWAKFQEFCLEDVCCLSRNMAVKAGDAQTRLNELSAIAIGLFEAVLKTMRLRTGKQSPKKLHSHLLSSVLTFCQGRRILWRTQIKLSSAFNVKVQAAPPRAMPVRSSMLSKVDAGEVMMPMVAIGAYPMGKCLRDLLKAFQCEESI